MAARAGSRAAGDDAGGTSLEAIARSCGALPPAAVCRLGRQIALALVDRHERHGIGPHGGIALDRIRVLAGGEIVLLGAQTPAIRTLSPERRMQGGRSVADDLWALGVLLADLALAGAIVDGERLSEANPRLPPRLLDALHMLVAPADERLTNASAAVCMLTEVEKDFGDGALLMRAALARARGADMASLTGPPTASMSPDQVMSVSKIRALVELGAAPTLPDAPPTPAPVPTLAPVEAPHWMLPAIGVAIMVVVLLALVWRLF